MHIFIKMRKKFSQTIEIPHGVEVKIDENRLIVKGKEGENSREFDLGKIDLEVKDNKIILSKDNSTKKEKRIMNTASRHIKNMIKGVQKKFEYRMKVCSSHFPISVKIEGNKGIIKNFIGEKVNRETTIPKGAEVKIDKDIIIVSSTDKEIAGQTAANFENATIIKNRDRRIFQDGIYIINKPGKETE